MDKILVFSSPMRDWNDESDEIADYTECSF